MEIREARKELYEWDAVKPDSGIGIGEFPPLSDEMVDWDADEPSLGPWTEENMVLCNTFDSGDGLRWEGSRR